MATKIRVIGAAGDIRAVLQALNDAPNIRVVDTSGPRQARYDEGVRVYAVVETTGHPEPGMDVTVTEVGPTALGDGRPARRKSGGR